MIDTHKNIEKFEELFNKYILPRNGADKLLEFIRKTDFYTAPASTKYHLSEVGGLLQHSLNVYECLSKKKINPTWSDRLTDRDETIAVIALLHDLCKTYTYGKEFKNQKVYDKDVIATAEPRQIKHDSKGDFVWMEMPTYVTDNRFPMGHGAKSIFFIQQFMKLSMEEIACIYWHMGAYGLNDADCRELGKAIERYPLILALQEADMESTYLLEAE